MLGGLIAIALLAWRLFGPAGRAPKAPAEAAQPVGVAKVGAGDMCVIMTRLGTVTPMATITVQTQINGQLMSVGFKEGQEASVALVQALGGGWTTADLPTGGKLQSKLPLL